MCLPLAQPVLDVHGSAVCLLLLHSGIQQTTSSTATYNYSFTHSHIHTFTPTGKSTTQSESGTPRHSRHPTSNLLVTSQPTLPPELLPPGRQLVVLNSPYRRDALGADGRLGVIQTPRVSVQHPGCQSNLCSPEQPLGLLVEGW